jgi:hypothetical protein
MVLRFAFNSNKAVEALAYIAQQYPGVTPFFVSKILYFAEKRHLNEWGRPIVADTYIAMQAGPVPSTVKDYIEGNFSQVTRPETLSDAVRIEKGPKYLHVYPGRRPPDLSLLSETDVECLDRGIIFCRKTPELSELTHREKAWANTPVNRAMDYEDFIDDDNPHREQILEHAREFAACGVL